jgi:predicted nuclease of predicted toxin-antitoxin system
VKLLIDQNLSHKLVQRLRDPYPESAHVRALGLHESADVAIWQYARDHEFILVSKDIDMMELCVLRGAPPKLIWLRLENCSTDVVEEVLTRNRESVAALAADPSRVYLSLFRFQVVE